MIKIVVNPERDRWGELTKRSLSDDARIVERTKEIIAEVISGGDLALRAITKRIDDVLLNSLIVTDEEIALAQESVSSELKQAIANAKENIERFHKAQISKQIEVNNGEGVRCIQRSVPIQKVGLYIPGGSAPLFSTVLMLAIPAKVAGCPSVILCTPPNKQGTIASEILYCASLCGVDKIYKVGGSQAIAAMAYGTKSIKAVDKIFGPGNRYVTAAKQIVSTSVCGIDMPAGPSEVMIMADESAVPQFVAADMLSQAEHGSDSQAVVVCNSMSFAKQTEMALNEQLKTLSRRDMAIRSLENSKIVVMDNSDEMVDFANTYAAEHLIISMENPWGVADRITAAGSIFIGNYSPESAGDYASGTNHTLPTSAWARSFSGVNLDSFVRKITYQELSRSGMQDLAPTVIAMAEAEGLQAHANAVKIRLER